MKRTLTLILAMLSLVWTAVMAQDTTLSAPETTVAPQATGTVDTTGLDDFSFEDELGSLDAELDAAVQDSTTSGTTTVAPAPTTGVDLSWGYKATDVVTVSEQGEGYVVLNVPAVKDANGQTVMIYKALYSTNSLAQSFDALSVTEKTFTFDTITGDTVSLKLDQLNTGTYYVVVNPMNKDNVDGEPTKEFSFVVEKGHGAAEVKLGNVTYTQTGSTVSMKWTPVAGADKVEVFVRSSSETDFKKLGNVAMNDAAYSLTVASTGDYYVKLLPVDGMGNPVGPEVIQTVKIEKIETPTDKPVPQVGPATNILLAILFFAIVAYFGLRYARTR